MAPRRLPRRLSPQRLLVPSHPASDPPSHPPGSSWLTGTRAPPCLAPACPCRPRWTCTCAPPAPSALVVCGGGRRGARVRHAWVQGRALGAAGARPAARRLPASQPCECAAGQTRGAARGLTTACSERAVSRVRTKMMVCPSFSHCVTDGAMECGHKGSVSSDSSSSSNRDWCSMSVFCLGARASRQPAEGPPGRRARPPICSGRR